jgi:hypothetical protein
MFQSLSSINIFHHVISWLYYILAANMFQIHLEIWSACNIQLALSETLPNKFYQFYYNQFRTHSEALVLIGTNMWWVCYSSPPLIMSFSPKANSLIRSDFRCNLIVKYMAFNIFQVYQYFTIYRWYFFLKFEQFPWYLVQLFKIRRYKDHFRRIKVPGTTPYWKTWKYMYVLLNCTLY